MIGEYVGEGSAGACPRRLGVPGEYATNEATASEIETLEREFNPTLRGHDFAREGTHIAREMNRGDRLSLYRPSPNLPHTEEQHRPNAPIPGVWQGHTSVIDGTVTR